MKFFNVIQLLLIAIVLCIGCNVTSSGEKKISINISGEAVIHEDDSPLKDVKVVLYRIKPGFFRDIEETVSEVITNDLGKFVISVEVKEGECEEWSYWINAWLYIVKHPEEPRQIDKKIPIQCTDTVQELKLRLRK